MNFYRLPNEAIHYLNTKPLKEEVINTTFTSTPPLASLRNGT